MGSRFRGNDAAADRLVLAVAPTAGSRFRGSFSPVRIRLRMRQQMMQHAKACSRGEGQEEGDFAN